MKTQQFLLGGLVAVIFLTQATFVSAQYAISQPPTKQFFIDKKIMNPQNNQYVDNLTVDQFQFLPTQEVVFRIEIKNTSNTDMVNVQVKDVLPQQLQFVSGEGSFDKSGALVWTMDVLRANSSKVWEIRTKVKSESEINSMVMCPTNLVQATIDNSMEQDSASFCIQKRVLGAVSELPKTGVSHFLLGIGIGVMGLVGSAFFWNKQRKVA